VNFEDKANIIHTKFRGETGFYGTTFREAIFSPDVRFERITKFRYVVFENGEKVDFGAKDVSNVSFLNTDITRIKFAEDVNWGGKDRFTIIDERELESDEPSENYPDEYFLFRGDKIPRSDKTREKEHKIRKESENNRHSQRITDFLKTEFGQRIPENTIFTRANNEVISNKTVQRKENKGARIYEVAEIEGDNAATYLIILNERKSKATLSINGKFYCNFPAKKIGEDKIEIYFNEFPSIDSIKAVYRNLRENYEYRLRYDEAGKFFIKEMELKRYYRTLQLKDDKFGHIETNGWARRNLFSLTGWYYHLSRYGESLLRPTIAGIAIISLSTLFFAMQTNPATEPSFF
jgi:hypothetical protein